MSHHKVIHRCAMLRIPLLCQRGMSQLDLIAIARDIVVVQHLIEQFLLLVMDKGIEQVAVSYVTRRQASRSPFGTRSISKAMALAHWLPVPN